MPLPSSAVGTVELWTSSVTVSPQVQRLRVERWFGYSTVYAAAPSYRRHVATPADK